MPRFRVTNRLISYPVDRAVIVRLLAGEEIPSEARGDVHAFEGDIVDDVPECSVPWLIAAGAIEPVEHDTPLHRTVPEAVAADLGRPVDTADAVDVAQAARVFDLRLVNPASADVEG